MNRRTTILTALAAGLLLLGGLAVLATHRGDPPPQGALTGSGLGGAFALIDQDGRPRTDRDFAGKYRLMYFGYTFCPDVCPTDVQKMSLALKSFEKSDPARAARVQPIFVTIDPARDTPAVIKEWVASFHPRLIGLTGSQAQVDKVLKAFRVFAAKAGSGPDYLMDHSAMIYLLGPDGAPIDFAANDATPAQIEAKLNAFVR